MRMIATVLAAVVVTATAIPVGWAQTQSGPTVETAEGRSKGYDPQSVWNPTMAKRRAKLRADHLVNVLTNAYQLTPEQQAKLAEALEAGRAKEEEYFIKHNDENVRISNRLIELGKERQRSSPEGRELMQRRRRFVDSAPLSASNAPAIAEKLCTPEQITSGRLAYAARHYAGDPWASYASEVIQRQGLNDAQQATVWSIVDELIRRRGEASVRANDFKEYAEKEKELFAELERRIASVIPSRPGATQPASRPG